MNKKQRNKRLDEHTWLIAKKELGKKYFSIYINHNGCDWEYLMSHRNEPVIFSLLSEKITLRQLYGNMKKATVHVAKSAPPNRKNGKIVGYQYNRVHSQRIENSILHLISVANSYIQMEIEDVSYVPSSNIEISVSCLTSNTNISA